MKKFFILACLALTFSHPAPAQNTSSSYPSQPITLIVPAGVGGITDSLARILADKLGSVLKQSVIVDNKAGASGVIGSSHVARAKPDGYTLLMVFPSHVVNPSLKKDLPYDTIKDFAPVAKVGTVSAILLVNADSKADSVQAFIDLAKQQPGVLNYGSVGVGSWGDTAMKLFQSRTGVELTHVPYKGDPQVIAALIQGDIQAGFVSPISSMAMMKAGKVKALAIADAERLPATPDLPTIGESGLPDFNVTGWNAVFAPAGTPADIVAKLNQAMNTALKDPDLAKKFLTQGVKPLGGTPEELQASVENDIKRIGDTLKAAGVEPS
ncbi:tripartite tricarboxylate transporter substrate binding protein [Pusillimonas sp. SM2304]|uniref:Bug family tripartite tricarboxylate transporter substrate binding protein n=1 Tax=Pusillimonas sp. SM2304 TaxID=3073241 RepID=UPI002874CA13|nr:tripartite tricarboxylate transporter substrate binding protein [Pusillimonas sp. SM2304]MDS1141857.1 tripartite tricarboxylate transporter substrate binding protein [Pusillimonas sp. SM2304]